MRLCTTYFLLTGEIRWAGSGGQLTKHYDLSLYLYIYMTTWAHLKFNGDLWSRRLGTVNWTNHYLQQVHLSEPKLSRDQNHVELNVCKDRERRQWIVQCVEAGAGGVMKNHWHTDLYICTHLGILYVLSASSPPAQSVRAVTSKGGHVQITHHIQIRRLNILDEVRRADLTLCRSGRSVYRTPQQCRIISKWYHCDDWPVINVFKSWSPRKSVRSPSWLELHLGIWPQRHRWWQPWRRWLGHACHCCR